VESNVDHRIRPRALKSIAVAVIVMASARSGTAQQLLAEHFTNRGYAGIGDSFGSAVSRLGDLDGDGVVDLLVASIGEDDDVYPWMDDYFGAVRVVSGATGVVIRKHLGPEKAGRLGMQIAGGSDFDGDGVPDYILASPILPKPSTSENGTVYVHSGASGALLFQWTGERRFDSFGACVRILGDVDADGVDDIGIGAPEYDASSTKGQAGRAYVYSGRSGAILYTYTGSRHDEWLGTLFGVGDVDSDGHADFLVGSYGWNAPPNGEGRFSVYSGATGALLYSRVGENHGDFFGGIACPLGDVDADGAPDFAVAAYAYDVVDSEGRVYVYSGPTGTLLYTIDGNHKDEAFGILPVSGRIDFNRDGYDDIVIGATYPPTSSTLESGVYVYSGINGRLLYRFSGSTYKNLNEILGASVDPIGDFDGDGFEDLAVGATNYSAVYQGEGRVYVFGGNDLLLQIEPTDTVVGDTVVADLRSGPPGLLGLFVMVDAAGTPLFEPLYLAPFDSFGELQLSASVPSSASGLDFTFQGYSQNRNGRGPLMDSARVTVTVN
jgi:hypothetical protein